MRGSGPSGWRSSVVTGSSGSAAAGSAVRRYCRARLGAVSGVGCADRLATSVVAQVTGGEDAPFDREAYRAAVRAVDRALASPPPPPRAGASAAGRGAPAPV